MKRTAIAILARPRRFMLPLYRTLEQNGSQRLRFIVYQAGHSYRSVSDRLVDDVARWIGGQ